MYIENVTNYDEQGFDVKFSEQPSKGKEECVLNSNMVLVDIEHDEKGAAADHGNVRKRLNTNQHHDYSLLTSFRAHVYRGVTPVCCMCERNK